MKLLRNKEIIKSEQIINSLKTCSLYKHKMCEDVTGYGTEGEGRI